MQAAGTGLFVQSHSDTHSCLAHAKDTDLLLYKDCHLFWQWFELARVEEFRCMLAVAVNSDGKGG